MGLLAAKQSAALQREIRPCRFVCEPLADHPDLDQSHLEQVDVLDKAPIDDQGDRIQAVAAAASGRRCKYPSDVLAANRRAMMEMFCHRGNRRP